MVEKRMNVKPLRAVKFMCMIMLIFAVTSISAFAGELYSTDVRQVYLFSDLMRAYVDVEDSNSNTIDNIDKASVAGYIDGNKLSVRSVKKFKDSDEGVADIFLIDVSGSMKNNQMEQVKTAIKTWASNMKDNDRIAVITFGESVNTVVDFSHDKNAINNAVNGIQNNDKQTQLFGGISEAIKIATRNDSGLPKRKNIVLITDGVNDYHGGVSESDIYNELKNQLIPVYSMWMSNSKADNKIGRSTLNSVTEYSGGKLYDMSDKNIDTVYEWIRQSVLNSYTVDFGYGDVVVDDAEHGLNVKIAQNGKVAEDTVQLTLKSNHEKSGAYELGDNIEDNTSKEKPEKTEKPIKMYLIVGIILFAAAAIIALIVMLIVGRKKENGDYENNTYSTNVHIPEEQHTNQTVSGIYVVFEKVDNGEVESVSMYDTLSIGRDTVNDFVVNDELVSAHHCVITLENGNMYIEDMQSTNGTIVNGILIHSKTQLKSNDLLLLGGVEYRVSFNI